MATIFTKIIQGDIPSYRVAEDDRHVAFLDVRPLKRGHTLVVPKREIDYIFDLEDEELAALHVFSKEVAVKIRTAVPCKRIGTAVVGLEVPHVHIHLIPLDAIDDTNFARPRLKFTPEEFEDIRKAIADA
ncbi:MAG: HIT family protein [Leptospirales bacterium]|jgi:histidine triad (HIT) family protein